MKIFVRLRFGDHHMQLNFVKGLCKRFVHSIGNLMKRMINGCVHVFKNTHGECFR